MSSKPYPFTCINGDCEAQHPIEVEITSYGAPAERATRHSPAVSADGPEWTVATTVTCPCGITYAPEFFANAPSMSQYISEWLVNRIRQEEADWAADRAIEAYESRRRFGT